MFGYKVKLEGELLEKVKKCVEAGGYESVDEFVVRVLEREIQKALRPDDADAASKELVKKRLQGLGYLE
jgi:Arc/MetJ-type ribon-helix-helix transcriptional regulator